jgi:hypothetical protein
MVIKAKNDDLAIPTFLKREKGEKPVKPRPVAAAAAKPAVVKAPATKPAAKTKPLTGKQLAQQRAGVAVTDKTKPAPAAPVTPVAPVAPVVDRGAVVKTAPKGKPAKSPKELVKAVKAHAKKFAHKNGWDLLLLQSDAEIEAEVTGLTSKAAAVKKMRTVAQGLDKTRPKKA